MKPLIAIIFAVIYSGVYSSLSAQNQGYIFEPRQCNDVVRINFAGFAGIGFESSIGRNFTIRPEAGSGWPVLTEKTRPNGATSCVVQSAFNPYLFVEGRYYYNLERRQRKGKNTSHYSGNFVSGFYRYSSFVYQGGFSTYNKYPTDSLQHDVQYIGAYWGIQRNIGGRQRFYFSLALGPGLKTNFKNYADFEFSAQLGFGLQW
jgi:hypothetical protein